MYVQNVEVLKDPEVVKQLGNILKTNVRACKSLGHPYMLQVCVIVLFTYLLCSRVFVVTDLSELAETLHA